MKKKIELFPPLRNQKLVDKEMRRVLAKSD